MSQPIDPRERENLRSWMQSLLDSAVSDHGVPGAAMAVSVGGDVIDVASGVVNRSTMVATTSQSAFQIGSITKVFTAVLVMQLVEDRLVDLDVPVINYLPEFRTADPAISARITARHLLNHTAGFVGDLFVDTGDGDDAIEKLVALLHTVPQISLPGELFSYSNAGFVVLGRLLEVVTGSKFDIILRDSLATPLGLRTCAVSAREAILGCPAIGHVPTGPSGQLEPTKVWSLGRGNAPAGAMLSMSATDLARFGDMFLRGGLADDGVTVLSRRSVAEMQSDQAACPDLGKAPSCRGLGWGIYDLPEGIMLGHDGGTVGQFAFLRVVPGKDTSIALLANGGDSAAVSRFVLDEVLDELVGLSTAAPSSLPAESSVSEPARYEGTYESGLFTMTVSSDRGNRMWLEVTPQRVLAEMGVHSERYELVPISENVFLRADATHGTHEHHVFVGTDGAGRARYLHTGRAHVRVDP